MSFDLLHDSKPTILREAAVTAHATWYSKYIDLATIGPDFYLEIEVAADANLDGSNYWVLNLMEYTGAAPQTASGYSEVAAAETDWDSTAHATNVTTFYADTVLPTIDHTDEDAVTIRVKYKGNCRYLHVQGVATSAGSYPTGVIGVRALSMHARLQPDSANTPVTGTVS